MKPTKDIFGLAILMLLFTSTPGRAEIFTADDIPQPDFKAFIQATADGFFIEAADSGSEVITIINISTSNGKTVIQKRIVGGYIDILANDLPPGEYLYHIKTIYTLDTPIGVGADRETEGATRQSGSFIINNHILETSRKAADEQAGLTTELVNTALAIIGQALDSTIPDTIAADLTVSSTEPTISFNDSTIGGSSQSLEWHIRTANGASTESSMRFFDLMSSQMVIQLYGTTTGTATTDSSFVVQSDGDIGWAGAGMFFDRSSQRLAIGASNYSPTLYSDLTIFSGTPDIRLFDESDTSNMEIELNNGNVGFWGRTAEWMGSSGWRKIISYDVGAPSNSLVIGNSGNLGLGVSSPTEALDVQRINAGARMKFTSVTNTANQAPQIIWRRAHSSIASSSPTAVMHSDNIGIFSFRGHDGNSWTNSRALINVVASQNWALGSTGTEMIFQTTPNNSSSLAEVMRITNDGKVRINGVTLNVPDYVFEEDYELMSLDQLATYIEEAKHLPGVASAGEVHSDGLDLAGSQMSVLEKVEELTLYTLQQHKQLKQLDSIRLENIKIKAAHRQLLSAFYKQQKELEVQKTILNNQQELVKQLIEFKQGNEVYTSVK